jgi:RimJ/RimL family protein N-acetyltransferase
VPDVITLRPFREDDLPLLETLSNDPEAAGAYQFFGWYDAGVVRKEFQESGFLDGNGGRLVVARDGERIGFVSFERRQTGMVSFCWEIGITLVAQARGHGHGTAVQRILVDYLFRHTLANRVEAETESTNVREQRSLEKAGFTREGVRRGCGYRDGHWRDMVMYGVLRAEVDLPDHESG